MPAAGAGRRPCCGCAKQQRRRQGEGQDDCTATRSCQGFFRVRNDIVDATFCVRRRKARNRNYLLNEVGPVIGTHALVAGGRQKDSASFCALGTQIHVGRPAGSAIQPVKFLAQYRFCGAGIRR